MTFTLCTSGAIVYEAGANANSLASTSAAILQQFSNNAEGDICIATRYDWVSNYGAITSYAKLCLASCAAARAGIDLIKYDMSGYTGRGEAEDMINVLYDRYTNAITILKNYKRPEVET